MKIVYIITRLDRGGSSEYLMNIAKEMKRCGFDVVVVYGGNKTKLSVRSINIAQLVRNISFLKDIIAFFRLFILIFKEKPEIVHTHTSKAGFLGRWAAFVVRLLLRSRLRIIHTPHGHIFYGYFAKMKSNFFALIEKITAYITDILIALTENEMKESISYGVGNERKWVCIPSGINYEFKIVEPQLKNKLGFRSTQFIAGSVMRLDDVKGDKFFVLAAAEVLKEKKDVFFVLVGDGPNMSKLKELARELNIEKKIIFAGWQENVYDWINIMDVYIQPSLNEGLGRTVIMAELLSKPVIASSVCGLKDLVIDGYNGFLVKPADVFSISGAILKLVSDADLRKLMGQRSYELVNQTIDGFKKYSFERSVFLHRKIYKNF